MVQFTVGEAELINRLGGQGRQDTEANFEKAMHGADSNGKKIMERTVRKLSELSDQGFAELVATTKNRKLSERDFSVRYRLSKIREQRKETEAPKGKDRVRRAEKSGMEL